jgi:predicted transcriptional regulator
MPDLLWSFFRDNPSLSRALPALAAEVVRARVSAKYGLRVGVIAILHTDPLEIVIVSDLMSPISQHVNAVEKTVTPEFFIYADCTCRSAAELMATEGIASLPVVDRTTQRINGTITLQDLLKGRSRAVVRENERLRLVSQLNNARGEHN